MTACQEPKSRLAFSRGTTSMNDNDDDEKYNGASNLIDKPLPPRLEIHSRDMEKEITAPLLHEKQEKYLLHK
uniref:Uncharacterized protein n=1 Tax=Romanomermis culicivorax TaxID=13658 RepID=A0A915L542_ROMCU